MTALLGIFNIVPGWVWALITAGAMGTSCVQTTRVSIEKTRHAETKAAYALNVADAEQAARIQSEKFRAIEQRLSDVQTEAETEASALRLNLDRARAAGGVSSVGLRNAVAAAATAARADCTATASAELRETAATASRLLADVHNELDRLAGVYAEEADRRGIAGRACERIHEEAVKLTAQ